MLKKPEESFSDIIEKLINGTSNVQEVIACYGISRSENEQEMLDAYAEARKTIRMGISIRLKEKE